MSVLSSYRNRDHYQRIVCQQAMNNQLTRQTAPFTHEVNKTSMEPWHVNRKRSRVDEEERSFLPGKPLFMIIYVYIYIQKHIYIIIILSNIHYTYLRPISTAYRTLNFAIYFNDVTCLTTAHAHRCAWLRFWKTVHAQRHSCIFPHSTLEVKKRPKVKEKVGV